MLFALIVQPALHQIEAAVKACGAAANLPLAALLQPHHGVTQDFVSCLWHDDLVVAIAAEAESLEKKSREVSHIVFQAFRDRGLEPGLSKGKTEWMLCPQGSQAKAVQRTLLAGDRHDVILLRETAPPSAIGTTASYRHLGSVVTCNASLLPEVRRRVGEAAAAGKPLRRHVFGNKGVPLRVRVILFRSLVLSRLLHNSGSWPPLQKGEAKVWQGGVLRLYKLLLTGPDAAHDAHITAGALCQAVGLPSPVQLLHFERARLLYQLAVRDCQPVLALLEAGLGSPRCWLSAAMEGICWLSSLCPEALPSDWRVHPLPDEVLTWIRRTGHKFGNVLKKAWGIACCQDGSGLEFLFPDAVPQTAECTICGFQAVNRTGLAGHLAHRHQLRSVVRRLLLTTSCPTCCRNFHTRTRAMEHLRKNPACLTHARASCPLIAESVAAKLDDAELRRLRSDRRLGRPDLRPFEEDAFLFGKATDYADSQEQGMFLEDFLSYLTELSQRYALEHVFVRPHPFWIL